MRIRDKCRPSTSTLSCGRLLFHSDALLSSFPPISFGPGSLEWRHIGLVPPTQDSPPTWSQQAVLPQTPADVLTLRSGACNALPLHHALHTRDLGHALTNLGYSKLRKPHCNVGNISGSRGDLDQLSHSRERTSPFGDLSPGLAGTGSFSSASGATDPACVTFYMVLLHAIRWCLHICPPASGIWSVSLAETRAELLTHTAALSTQSTTSQLPTTSSCSENTWSWRISKYFLPLPEREALLFLG